MVSRVPEPISRSSQVAWRSAASEIGRDHQQLVLEPGLHGQVGLVTGPLDQSEVQMKRGHLRGDGCGVRNHDLYLERTARRRRQSLLKLGQDAGKQVVADRGAGTHAQLPDLRFAVARPTLERPGAVEQRQRLG